MPRGTARPEVRGSESAPRERIRRSVRLGNCGWPFRVMRSWLRNWRERHRHPCSFWLHMAAIPMLPAAGVLAVLQLLDGAWPLWWRPAGLVVLSYVLQWIGHRVEGNDLGEVILIKKWLGRPYVAIAPRPVEGRPKSQES